MKIQFSTSNAAFHDDYADEIVNKMNKEREVVRILYTIINAIQLDDADHGPIMDINGNKIGSWEL